MQSVLIVYVSIRKYTKTTILCKSINFCGISCKGAPKVKVSPRRKYQQEFTERTPEYELTEIELTEMDYSRETNPLPLVEGETLDLYRIVSEMDRYANVAFLSFLLKIKKISILEFFFNYIKLFINGAKTPNAVLYEKNSRCR